MKTSKRAEQARVPVNQPTHFPRLYFIPETTIIPSHRTASNASNAPHYHQSQPTCITTPQEPAFRKYARIKMTVLQQACAGAWAAIKALGRATVRWLARWVVLPISIACILWIPIAGPAELPL